MGRPLEQEVISTSYHDHHHTLCCDRYPDIYKDRTYYWKGTRPWLFLGLRLKRTS